MQSTLHHPSPFLYPYQILCIVVRLSIAFFAFCVSNGVLLKKSERISKGLAVLLLIPAIVMLFLWTFGLRKHAFESIGTDGGITWWNSLRPVHATLLATYSLLTLFSRVPQHAHVALFVDAGVAFGAFVQRNACNRKTTDMKTADMKTAA
jgi:cytochrome bd-type quinol oxidase subunit 2